MPYISYNSEKLEESSLPPRVGQEHCQQQFHHRFVCLHLFFLWQTFSSSDKLRERRATQQSRDCNLAIILISTVVMFFLCHLPRVVTRLVFFALLWSPSPTPSPTSSSLIQSSAFMRRRTSTPFSIAGKEVTLNSRFNKEHEKHHDSHLYLKKHCAILSLQGGTRPQFGSCTSPTLFNSSWWVTEAFYHTCNQFEILILNCDMKHRKNCECCPGRYLSTSVY